VAFSPDGRLLAAVSGEPKDQGALAVWEIATKQQRLFHQEAVGVPSVAFAPDGKSVAIGLFEPVAKLLDVDSGTVVRSRKQAIGCSPPATIEPSSSGMLRAARR
jgi:WD40 repeat protein